jgi:hypothetical protein
MLSLFPELLFLAPLSALLIRVVVAITFGYSASRHLSHTGWTTRIFGILEGLCAAFCFVGLYTQGAALLGFALCIFTIVIPRYRTLPLSTIFLLATLSVSLLVTGPGPFTLTVYDVVLPVSFDLPL